jgi:2-methylcitrate synthase
MFFTTKHQSVESAIEPTIQQGQTTSDHPIFTSGGLHIPTIAADFLSGESTNISSARASNHSSFTDKKPTTELGLVPTVSSAQISAVVEHSLSALKHKVSYTSLTQPVSPSSTATLSVATLDAIKTATRHQFKKNVALSGVIAGQTELARLDRRGYQLTYRGYSALDLAKTGTYEEISYLLLYGDLPNQSTLMHYQRQLTMQRGLPIGLLNILEQLPATANPIDVLISGVNYLAMSHPEISAANVQHTRDIALRLIAGLPSMLGYWHQFSHYGRRLNVNDMTAMGHTSELLLSILDHNQKPSPLQIETLDRFLILSAEHEFSPSAFAGRVAASTGSDMYAVVIAGFCALKGDVHGGAMQRAIELIQRYSTLAEAEQDVLQRLATGQTLHGFGHFVYTQQDPRTAVAKQLANQLCQVSGEWHIFKIAEHIEEVVRLHKGLFANFDWYAAIILHHLLITPSLYIGLSAIARVTGFIAHGLEQRQEGMVIRPNAEYIGDDHRQVRPLFGRI